MLKISISGVRGTVPDSLTDDVVLDFAKAFGTYIKGGSIVIGCDTRRSSESIKGVVIEGLRDCGCDVVDLGLATTPTVGIMVRHIKARGGVIVTASHNPEPWNGLKFVRNDGIFLNPGQAKALLDIYYEKKFKAKKKGSAISFKASNKIHIEKILKFIDVKAIKRSKFKVAIDCCNGAGSVITPMLLKKLGCTIVSINTRPASPFGRGAEPTPDNLKDLAALVKKENADIGFAQDPDADRLAIVDETGTAVSEEYTLALCMKLILSSQKTLNKIVVANLSTTAALDDIAAEFGAKIIRTKIGEVYVAEAIKKEKAIIGGEGNGGVIFPKIGFNRDSLAGIALILMLLTRQKKKLSRIISEIPKYELVKNKIECKTDEEGAAFIEKMHNKFKNEKLDLTEGIKVIRPYGWLHLRPSNTEPIIRIFAEAKDRDLAEKFIAEALGS